MSDEVMNGRADSPDRFIREMALRVLEEIGQAKRPRQRRERLLQLAREQRFPFCFERLSRSGMTREQGLCHGILASYHWMPSTETVIRFGSRSSEATNFNRRGGSSFKSIPPISQTAVAWARLPFGSCFTKSSN